MPHDHHHDHDHHGHDHGHGHHGHDHGHVHHGHHHVPDTRQALLVALALNGGFLVLEAVVGWWTGSLALLSDAAHMMGDVAALVLALGAAQLARRAADASMTFGLRRAEVLGAFLNGVALLVVVVGIFAEALQRLSGEPVEVDGWPVLFVGLAGLAINAGSAIMLARSGSHDLNVQGALWHMVADALGSVGAVVAAVALMSGLPAADPLVSLLVAALAGWGGWRVTRDAGRVLLELPPPGFDVGALKATLASVDGVASVHDLHVWTLDGQRPMVTAHLATTRPAEANAITSAALAVARERHDVAHATFQVEQAGAAPCPSGECGA